MVSAGGGDARLQGAPRPPPGRQPRPGHPAPVQPAAGAGAAQPADRLSGAAKIVGSLVKQSFKRSFANISQSGRRLLLGS